MRRWFGPAAGLIAGAGPGADAGRGADVPVQQPGRPARAAADRRRVHDGPGPGERPVPVAGVRRRCCSASRSWPRCCRRSWSCPGSRSPTCGPGRRSSASGSGRCCWPAPPSVVGGGWWVAIAELVPAADRPYFGGSTNNNILQLAIGYNGLGRLDGTETGSIGGGGGGGGGGFGGATGITRLFSSEFGGQISWLLPAALISLPAMLWVSRRAVRTDRTRAAALLWGGWLLCTGLVFSYMSGIIHPYYMVALAPAIAALVAWAPWRCGSGGSAGSGASSPRRRSGHRLVGGGTARPVGVVVPVAALGDHPGRRGRGGVRSWPVPGWRGSRLGGRGRRRRAAARAGRGSGGMRAGRGAHRARRVRDRHGGDHAYRVHPECRDRKPRVLRWPGRGRRWRAGGPREAGRDRHGGQGHGRPGAAGTAHQDGGTGRGPRPTAGRHGRDRDRRARRPGRIGGRTGGRRPAAPAGPAASAGTPG